MISSRNKPAAKWQGFALAPLAVVLIFSHEAFGKEGDAIPKPPPMAVPSSASVCLGASVDVTLQISGRIVEPVTFLIRKQPAKGTLGTLKRTGKNSAIIRYTPDEGSAPGGDVFSFAVKSVDSPVSAPASIRVTVSKPAPSLEMPSGMDFGSVYIGGNATRVLPVRNKGTAGVVLRFELGEPWALIGPSSRSIAPQAQEALVIRFSPREQRDYSGRMKVAGDAQGAVDVSGSGQVPVTWNEIVFSEENRRAGYADIKFSNQTPSALALEIFWPEFIVAPTNLTVPAGSCAAARVAVSGNSSRPLEGAARVRCGEYSGEIPIKISPAPAALELGPDGYLTFAARDGKALSAANLTVKNAGGSDTALRVSLPEGFRIHPDPAGVIVAAGGQQDFEIECPGGATPGGARQVLGVEALAGGCKKEIEMKLPAADASNPSARVQKFLSLPKSLAAPPVPNIPSSSAPVKSLRVLASTPHEIAIAWQTSSGDYAAFRVECRRISPGANGEPVIEWVPWQDCKFQKDNGMTTCRIAHLPANSKWTLRVVGIDSSGVQGPPSAALQVSTAGLPRFAFSAWVWVVVIAVALAATLALVNRVKKSRLARDGSKIARLEAEQRRTSKR